MTNLDHEAVKALPTESKGFLGPIYKYLGKKYERREDAMAARDDALRSHGLDPTHYAVPDKPDGTEPDKAEAASHVVVASEEVPGDYTDAPEEVPIAPPIVTWLNVLGVASVIGGVAWMRILWPDSNYGSGAQTAFAFSVGLGIAMSSLFPFGLAKIIELLSRMEHNLRR